LTAGPSATISIYVNQYYFTVEGKQRAR
jgi:hypothetical protein